MKYTKVLPPQWATKLRDRVIADRVRNAVRGPQLYWYLRHDGAHGRAWNSINLAVHERKVKMYAPLEEGMAARYVLLHELAHVLTPGQSHSKDFWGVCLFLCKTYGDFPDGYVEERAINYMPGKAGAVLGGDWERKVAERKARALRQRARQPQQSARSERAHGARGANLPHNLPRHGVGVCVVRGLEQWCQQVFPPGAAHTHAQQQNSECDGENKVEAERLRAQ